MSRVYSFTTVLREAAEMMTGRNASALTMSYYGSDKVVPHYNVMGFAMNRILDEK